MIQQFVLYAQLVGEVGPTCLLSRPPLGGQPAGYRPQVNTWGPQVKSSTGR